MRWRIRITVARAKGIFIIAPIGGRAGEIITGAQRRFDPKLAAMGKPHITINGSSGTGPIMPGTTERELRAAALAFPETAPRFAKKMVGRAQ